MKKLLPLLIILLVMSSIAMIFISMAEDTQPVTVLINNKEVIARPLRVNFSYDS